MTAGRFAAAGDGDGAGGGAVDVAGAIDVARAVAAARAVERQGESEGEPPVRLRLDLSYDGTDFSGWARQPDRRTVQGVLEDALDVLFRSGAVLTVAGRTDAGVHATGQVAHLDVPSVAWAEQPDRVLRGLNGLLPPDIRVYSVSPAPVGFDARFSAEWRAYRYRISDADWGVRPLDRRNTAAWRRRLDDVRMHEAAQLLLGLNDYTAFCKRRDGATAIRTLQQLDVLREGPLVTLIVRADAFCHSMVRSLVGALAAVGEGHRPLDWPASLLGRPNRCDEVKVAPAHGLTLTGVGYPDSQFLADRATLTRAVRTTLR
ncbi:tRNA pseudouridine(38-40) synthase TruA [Jatrophihabitans telluris]|uniref:tRNA pseudouridine synthase A n=1 Tax=Jatrophihabitans telluris TaxID=2038343 RepID=A0ABY4QX44_9ACTN|nr:tRNA pseudouridine(38-40) synthase TruA [Jatrophihabitans telluris]UQX87929.1 tRNA pseudouridine(38-40) synthase TruA [Jatrophihabitans telluris]